MKVKNNIQKIGYFWLPSNPENKLAGIISIEDGGKISLELHGLFGVNPYELYTLDNMDIILGDVDEEGEITLVDSVYSSGKHWMTNDVKAKNHIESDYIFIGTHFNTKNELKINSFSFRVEGLNDWVGISGINIDNSNMLNPSISYIMPDDIDIGIDNMPLKLSITYNAHKKGFWGFHAMDNDHAEIYQETYLKLYSENNIPFSLFFDLSKKIANFLIFAINKQVSIEEITVQHKGFNILYANGKDTDIQKDIKVFTNKILHTSNIGEVTWNTMMFRYRDIDNFEDIINKWLSMYNTIDPSLDLYFSTIFSKDKYVKSQFLMFAQALESLHSRLNSKKKYFKERLEELSQDFIDMGVYTKDEMHEFTTKIKDTRNYLTHYDKSKEKKTVVDDEYQVYINTMQWLLQIHFLKLLGFEQAKILEFLKIK